MRNVEDLHNKHSDRTCGCVIEMDLRTAARKSLRVHGTAGDLGNVLPAITIQPAARCLEKIGTSAATG
jgi:hypothetical protein